MFQLSGFSCMPNSPHIPDCSATESQIPILAPLPSFHPAFTPSAHGAQTHSHSSTLIPINLDRRSMSQKILTSVSIGHDHEAFGCKMLLSIELLLDWLRPTVAARNKGRIYVFLPGVCISVYHKSSFGSCLPEILMQNSPGRALSLLTGLITQTSQLPKLPATKPYMPLTKDCKTVRTCSPKVCKLMAFWACFPGLGRCFTFL